MPVVQRETVSSDLWANCTGTYVRGVRRLRGCLEEKYAPCISDSTGGIQAPFSSLLKQNFLETVSVFTFLTPLACWMQAPVPSACAHALFIPVPDTSLFSLPWPCFSSPRLHYHTNQQFMPFSGRFENLMKCVSFLFRKKYTPQGPDCRRTPHPPVPPTHSQLSDQLLPPGLD